MASGTKRRHPAGRRGIVCGISAGIAVHHAALMILSYTWHFGYYVPCAAVLNEPFGGELNAALFEMLLSGEIGAIIAVCADRHRERRNSPRM